MSNLKEIEIKVNFSEKIGRINKNLYGHFAEHLGRCIYEGFWVGEDSSIPNTKGIRNDVVGALKELNIPVLRWPGGCFADDYHWRDGIGSRNERPTRINKWWNSLESNQFGTHEFMDLCDQLDCEAYICGNVGSGTVEEMSHWIEYLNCPLDTTLAQEREKNGSKTPFQVRYWGVGNENWGCGGKMCPAHYGNLYKKYATYCHSFEGAPLYLIGCGPNRFDYNWTDKFLDTITGKSSKCPNHSDSIHGMSFHYYCGTAGTATEYNELQWYSLLMNAIVMEELIEEHRKIMDKYDPNRNIDLICDEWGTWHPPSEGEKEKWLWQQNTIRDALVAAITLDIFNNHANIIKMANIAQTVNVLQAMILTNQEKMLKTPTYHVFHMYKSHQEAMAIDLNIESPMVSPLQIEMVRGSCSIKDNELFLSLVNLDHENSAKINLNFTGGANPEILSWEVLKGADIHDHNTFDEPNKIHEESKSALKDLILDPASVNVITFSI